MTDSSDDSIWKDILLQAVQEGVAAVGGAVPGAHLRGVLESVASRAGLSYPPQSYRDRKFKDFLSHFAGLKVVVIRERSGQDLLVAPFGEPQLLLETSQVSDRSWSSIRQDLFEAFTKISSNEIAWYNTETDKIVWELSEPQGDDPVWVRIPSATVAQAMEDRSLFFDGLVEHEKNLFPWTPSTNDGLSALREFSNAVRVSGFQPQWHRFRSKLLADRISEWAKSANIPWQQTWITSSSDGRINDERSPRREWRGALTSFVGELDQSDLARISVPLDIVIKIFQKIR